MQALDTKPHKAIVDLGNRGVDKANPDIDIKHRGKFKGLTGEEKKVTQTTASDRIDHRSLEGGSSDEPVPPQGIKG